MILKNLQQKLNLKGKKLFLITLFIGFVITNATAKGKIPVCIPCEKIALVKTLPNDSTGYVGSLGDNLDIGYKYNEYGAIWLPLWNTGGTYVLTNKSKDTYYDLTPDEKADLTKNHQLDVTKNPLSFWQKIGGKLVFIVLLIVLFFVKMVRK